MSTQLAYNKDEAAKVAGVSTKTLDRAIKAGRLRAKRSGMTEEGEPAGKILILPGELAAWLEGLADV